MAIDLPKDYRPSADEPFMNEMQKEFFRRKLVQWREELLQDSENTIDTMKQESGMTVPDISDRASAEADKALELRTRDRMRKVISKINKALARIDDGSYGYCEDTGEPIGLERLIARPVATLSIEAQERHERMEKTYNDD